MRFISIPPYKGMQYTPTEGHFMVNELIAKMRQRGQLDGIDIDVDEGYDTGHKEESRDEEFLAKISLGMIQRVKMYHDSGKYDAIITSGTMGMGFFASRMLSKIPVAFGIHSAIHVASLIGDRFSVIEATDAQALITRHCVQLYGLDNKLASVRYISRSSTYMVRLIRGRTEKERINDPNIKSVVEEITGKCKEAIEQDRADTLIFGCTPLQLFLDEIRHSLDERGYGEIQLIGQYAAAVEMARVMVNMRLKQAPRAYPSDLLKAKPSFR